MSVKIHPSNRHLLEGGVPAEFLETLGSLEFISLSASARMSLFADWKSKQTGSGAAGDEASRLRAEREAKNAAALAAAERGDAAYGITFDPAHHPAPPIPAAERIALARAEGSAQPDKNAPPARRMVESDLPPGMRNLIGAAKLKAMRQVQSVDPLRAKLASHNDGTQRMSPNDFARTKAEFAEAWHAVCAAGGGNRI